MRARHSAANPEIIGNGSVGYVSQFPEVFFNIRFVDERQRFSRKGCRLTRQAIRAVSAGLGNGFSKVFGKFHGQAPAAFKKGYYFVDSFHIHGFLIPEQASETLCGFVNVKVPV
jgi:hypothetical protein